MRHVRAIVLAFGLAGCSTSVGFHSQADRDAALATFRNGQASLACGNGLGCALGWTPVRPAAERFAQSEQWDNLAEVVLAQGYDIDLTWFYLGLAAEGLGYNDAARVYYQTSMRRTTVGGLSACGGDLCGPVVLPDDAQRMLAQLATSKPPVAQRQRPTRSNQATAKAAAKPAAAGTDWQSPGAAPASSGQWVDPGATPTAATPASATGGSGWVTPTPTPVAHAQP